MMLFRNRPTDLVQDQNARLLRDIARANKALADEQQLRQSIADGGKLLYESQKAWYEQRIALLENDLAVATERADRLEADLGREREDHNALQRKYAGHMNVCAQLDAVDQEDAAKARSR